MAFRLLCGKASAAAFFCLFMIGCTSKPSYQSDVSLDCDDRYTRCAAKVEPLSEMPPSVAKIGETSISDAVLPIPFTEPMPSFAPVVFSFDNANASLPDIKQAVNYLLANSKATLTLHGHTDPIGRKEYNLDLSYQRAEYVRQRLILSGVPEQQLIVKAHGESRLVTAQLDSLSLSRDELIQRYAPNRRVEWVFTSPEPITQSN